MSKQHSGKKPTKSRATHSPRVISIKGTCGFPWPICAGCGLVYLKNEETAAAIRKPCDAMEEA